VKYFLFLLSFTATIGLTFALNTKLGVAPPFGKFLSPFTGFWQNAVDERKPADVHVGLTGLKDSVNVYYDDRLVPHIFAQNDEDLYYMQGFITAQNRLWQMEIQTHAAAGRVSEIVGEGGLENDRYMRRLGMGYGAEKSEQFIAKDTASQQLLMAYCNGINAYISSLSPKDYPVEYKLLDYKPEAWTPIKVALLLKNMSYMLSVYEYDVENTNFINTYGRLEFDKLFPSWVPEEDPIIPTGAETALVAAGTAPLNAGSRAEQGRFVEMAVGQTSQPAPGEMPVATPYAPKHDHSIGSNNWAVSGSKTKSGKPILCNDPHLKLSHPSIWYEMHLHAPGMNVYGATLPGAPAVIIGFNDSIAWGVTNGGRDVRDWYRVEYKDASRTAYKLDGEFVPATFRIEKYNIRGKGEFIDTVVYTKFGPVVYDKNFGKAATQKDLSMKWTAHMGSNEFKTFYLMNKGKNHSDYIAALDNYTCPSQNFVFASRSGDIAIKEQGKFPIRDRKTEQGFTTLEATTANDWSAYIPSDKNPHVLNPARGFVSSANQHPIDSTYPYYYPGVGVYENYRNRRINQLLAAGSGIDVGFMKKMHSDNYFLCAAEVLPTMLQLLNKTGITEKETQIIAELAKWDFFNNPEELAPVYFEIWWNEYRRLLWDELQDPAKAMKQPSFNVIVRMLKTDSTSQFYDNLSTPVKETRNDLINASFKAIAKSIDSKEFIEVHEPYGRDVKHEISDITKLDWGKYKATRVEHLARLAPFSTMNVYNGGNLGIINATNSSHGPSWRMIVDFGDMKGYVVYPAGQSGNPGSKYYDNMVSTWAKGEYYTALFTASEKEISGKRLFVARYSSK
jgi:penicillin amidase